MEISKRQKQRRNIAQCMAQRALIRIRDLIDRTLHVPTIAVESGLNLGHVPP